MNQPQSQRKHRKFNGLCKYLICTWAKFYYYFVKRSKWNYFSFDAISMLPERYEVNFSWTTQKFIMINSLESTEAMSSFLNGNPRLVEASLVDWFNAGLNVPLHCRKSNFRSFSLHSISLANENVSQSIIYSTLHLSLWNWFLSRRRQRIRLYSVLRSIFMLPPLSSTTASSSHSKLIYFLFLLINI